MVLSPGERFCFISLGYWNRDQPPFLCQFPPSSLSLCPLILGNQAYLRVTKASLGTALTTTSCPCFVLSFLSPDASSTWNSLQNQRNLMFLRSTLSGCFGAKPAGFKTSPRTQRLLHGESVLLRLWNNPGPPLSFRKWNCWSGRVRK